MRCLFIIAGCGTESQQEEKGKRPPWTAEEIVMANKNTLTLLLAAIITSFGVFVSPAFAATPGTWAGTAEFGTFEIVVDAQGTAIERLNLTFSNYTCGSVTVSGGVGFGGSWPITNDSFSITRDLNSDGTQELTIAGTFNSATQASGTFRATMHGVVCNGTWQATIDGGVEITGGHSGSFVSPARDGEGFIIEVLDGAIVAYWFTYANGRQMWLVGAASLSKKSTSVTIPMIVTNGTGFGAAFDTDDVVDTNWGNLTLEFFDCTSGQASCP